MKRHRNYTNGGSHERNDAQSSAHDFGRDLEFDGVAIRGFLEDGSSIDMPVQLFNRAAVRLVAVPEPGVAALLLLGAVGLAATHRRVRT